ncbi:MAG: hypothetical protein KDC79_12910 [Cyclobacteriaceae bacterium]|nr:hypothetical protein [Cyclobacteriaceae bacterium]
MKSYLKDLTVVAIGVLIALLLNSFKESYQANQYHKTSLKTIESEISENLSDLNEVLDKQIGTLDTLKKYQSKSIAIDQLFAKSSGLQAATLRNVSLEFYSRNNVSNIDYEIMSNLIRMKSLSELITVKLNKLVDYLYPNIFEKSEESKLLTIMYLENLIESETQLTQLYKSYLEEHKKVKSNME